MNKEILLGHARYTLSMPTKCNKKYSHRPNLKVQPTYLQKTKWLLSQLAAVC